MTHGRYPYSPINARPVYDWPGGKRLALYIGVNLEWFSFGEGLGAELAPAGPQPDVLNYSWRDYGNRVGVFRLADMFESSGCRYHCWSTRRWSNTRRKRCRVSPGAEMIGHGRTNSERQGTLSEAEERALITETTTALEKHCGAAPARLAGPLDFAIAADARSVAGGGLHATCSTGATTTSRYG